MRLIFIDEIFKLFIYTMEHRAGTAGLFWYSRDLVPALTFTITCSGTRTSPGKWFLSSRVTLNGASFNGIPAVLTVIADPGARFLQVVCIRMTT